MEFNDSEYGGNGGGSRPPADISSDSSTFSVESSEEFNEPKPEELLGASGSVHKSEAFFDYTEEFNEPKREELLEAIFGGCMPLADIPSDSSTAAVESSEEFNEPKPEELLGASGSVHKSEPDQQDPSPPKTEGIKREAIFIISDTEKSNVKEIVNPPPKKKRKAVRRSKVKGDVQQSPAPPRSDPSVPGTSFAQKIPFSASIVNRPGMSGTFKVICTKPKSDPSERTILVRKINQGRNIIKLIDDTPNQQGLPQEPETGTSYDQQEPQAQQELPPVLNYSLAESLLNAVELPQLSPRSLERELQIASLDQQEPQAQQELPVAPPQPGPSMPWERDRGDPTRLFGYYMCEYCPYKCKKSTQLIDHSADHMNPAIPEEKPNICTICPYFVNDESDLVNHLILHATQELKKTGNEKEENIVYKCEECPYTSCCSKQYLYHATHHQLKLSLKCYECTYTNSEFLLLILHKRIVHKPTQCS